MKIAKLLFASTLLAASSAGPAFDESGEKLPPDRPPSLMTGTEIKAYNAGLDNSHPYYIRCRKDAVIGSLARKLRVCRTNEEWKKFAAQGNDNSREIYDEMSHAPINQGNPDPCNIGRC